jgi:hypothetical protein
MTGAVCTLAVPEKCERKAVLLYVAYRDGQIVQVSARCQLHKRAIALSLAARMAPNTEWFTAGAIKPAES